VKKFDSEMIAKAGWIDYHATKEHKIPLAFFAGTRGIFYSNQY